MGMPLASMDLAKRLVRYQQVEYAGDEHRPEPDNFKCWEAAEGFVDTCQEDFSAWVVMKAALRCTKVGKAAGSVASTAAAVIWAEKGHTVGNLMTTTDAVGNNNCFHLSRSNSRK